MTTESLLVSKAVVRFSALHLEEGLFNLYDGELGLKWLGEDRFHLNLRSQRFFADFRVNLHNLMYAAKFQWVLS